MKLFIVEPRDTALFRDARPFAGNAPAVSMQTPWPSTLAGLFRTLQGQDINGMWVGDSNKARQIPVAGPLLVRLKENDEIAEFYFPAPADAVFFKDEKSTDPKKPLRVYRLHPSKGEEFISNLPDGLMPTVFDVTGNLGKASSGPAWWTASQMFAWLDGKISDGLACAASEFGISLPESEERVHVGIDSETLTSEDGNLFMTHMRRFVTKELERFALLAWTDANVEKNLSPFGGERRLSRVVPVKQELPKPPESNTKRLRVVLITPGLFSEGWRPSDSQLGGGKLVAACVGRPQSVSGWSYENPIGPKPSRRMAPAGSIYWLDFESPAAAGQWAKDHQYKSIADNEQDRRDGFGIIIVGRGE